MAVRALRPTDTGSSRGRNKGSSFGKGPAIDTTQPLQFRGQTPGAKQNYQQPDNSWDGGQYGGSPGYVGGGPFTAYSGAAAAPSEQDWLKGDSIYQAAVSALAKQLQNFETDVTSQRDARKLDYDQALSDLGYIAPSIDGGEANWNFNDSLTASGRGYQNQLNDFAARGMLQSQSYADSLNDLIRSLNDQYTGLERDNTQFNTDLDRQLAKARDENTAASQAARAESIMRRAAQYGL